MAGEFEVVEIVQSQWHRVRDLRREMLADSPTAFVETLADALAYDDDEWRARTRRLGEPGNCGFAAVDRESGRWIGTMRGRVFEDGRPFLLGVYVTPSHRGSAAATVLLERVEAWARGHGQAIYLQVHEQNRRAQAFYLRQGYRFTGVTEPYPLDESTSELEMRHDLAAGEPGAGE